MAVNGVPDNYLNFNAQSSKQLAYVIKIAGVPDVFTTVPISTKVLFGDPGVTFGSGLVFGGLRPYSNADGSSFRSLLDLESSSMTISQRIEPEQGKSTVSGVTLSFIDQGGYMTQVCSPGVIIPEILGAEVQIFIGFAQTSYPQDFYRIFRGYVTQASVKTGKCTLQISDANLKRRQQLFFCPQTTLTTAAASTDTTLAVANTYIGSSTAFFSPIFGPSGGCDPAVATYVIIDSEWIRTQPSSQTSFGGYTDTVTLGTDTMKRGAHGTTAAAHALGANVNAAVMLQDHPLTMALKVMLSGWNGPWLTGTPIQSIGPYPDSNSSVNTTNYVVLPSKKDAVADYQQTVGDWVSIQNSTANADVGFYQITGFGNLDGQTNRIIYLNATLYKEGPTSAKISFRSQYDTYPVSCGMRLTPKDVDIAGHVNLKNTFLGTANNLMTFFITKTATSGKEWIEKQLYLPISCYSVTRNGLLSVGLSTPPLAGTSLQVIDPTNVLNPQELEATRVINGRYFYNEVDVSTDVKDDGSTYQSLNPYLDANTFNAIGYASALTIKSDGMRTKQPPDTAPNDAATITNAGIYITRAQKNLISKFKSASAPLKVRVNWQTGSLIECGDVVLLNDNGILQIANFNTGQRNFGSQLLFVTERSLDLKSGNCTLSLISSFGTQLTDRFAVISPSSYCDTGSTSSALILKSNVDSNGLGPFGSIYGAKENLKWSALIGLDIIVHSTDFSVSGQTTLTGFDPINPLKMNVSPALSFTPAVGYVIELANYPTSTDPKNQQAAKAVYAYLTPTVSVVSGMSTTVFTVGASDISKFFVGCAVRIHNSGYTIDSGDTDFFVKSINTSTNQITLTKPLSFTPAAGQYIDLIGFADSSGPYRFI